MRQDGGVTQDVLAVGSATPRRDIRPGFVIAWVGVGLVFALSVMTVAVTTIGVWATRTVEADALMTRVQASETVMSRVQEDVAAVFAELEGPEDLNPATRQDLFDQITDIAAAGETAIAAAGSDIANLQISSWNPAIEQARIAYLAHNAAWVNYMAAAAQDPGEILLPQPEVNDTFFAAKEPLWRADPRFDPLELRAEVLLFYADDEGDASGGGGIVA